MPQRVKPLDVSQRVEPLFAVRFVNLRGLARLKLDGIRFAGTDGAARARAAVAQRSSFANDVRTSRGAWRARVSAARIDLIWRMR